MNNNANQVLGALAGMLICLLVVFAIVLLIYIFFLLTLQRTQAEVSERNREMAPGLVWLTLIPLFSTFWVLYMVPKLSNSLANEYRDRGWSTSGENFARTTGMIWAWGGVITTAISIIQNVLQAAQMMEPAMILGLVNLPIGLTIFVCWIIFWVQMAGYGKTLRSEGRRRYRDDDEADYDDDYRPRRERLNDDDDDDRPRRRNDDDDGDDDYDRRSR